MKSLIKKIISFTSTISLIWSLAACSFTTSSSTEPPAAKQTVATPVFSVESGEVTSGTTVEITCSTEGAAIFYTTNESDPTAESTRYTTSIAIKPPMTIKAIAIKDGMNDSAVAEVVYEELIIDYFGSDGCNIYDYCFEISNENFGSYKISKADGKIYCTYYSDSEGKNELSKEILTYSVSGDIASLKGESGTEFAININTKEFVTKKIVFNNIGYDFMDVWYEVKSADLSNYLSALPNNTKDTPYKIKVLDLTYETQTALQNTNKFVSLTIPDSVTSIVYEAFAWCSSLTSITIPDSVTSIGERAFEYCSSLTSITIPSSVTSIGERAFSDCSSLTSITIPDSVTSIGDSAFSDCKGLVSIMVDPDNRNYMSSNGVLFNKDQTNLIVYPCGNKSLNYTIPDSVTSIGNYAFYGCSSLTSITIPDSVTSIGKVAFADCSSLTSITIPDSVTSIGDWAFAWCSSLTSITIPDSVTSIGNIAFADCSSLTSITIPSSVTSIGDSAFSGCSSLTSITIPNSVTSIGNSAFSKCSSLTSITIPNSVTSIGDSAFYYCSSLTSITIPDSVTSIGKMAFEDCSSLTSITIPNSVTSIGNYAFEDCSSLTSITIPNSVTSIGYDAFRNCSKLSTINYKGTQEQWNAISKGSYWNYGVPSTYVINYNYQE